MPQSHLAEIYGEEENYALVRRSVPLWRAKEDEYREGLRVDRVRDEATLRSARERRRRARARRESALPLSLSPRTFVRRARASSLAPVRPARSSAFWLVVFECDGQSREDLEAYFRHNEKGPMRTFATDAATAPGLDMLFGKLAFVRAGPVARFWFLWWHALWEGNSEVPEFEANEDILDPDQPTAIATTPMPRAEVERVMNERGLEKWVNAKLLDVLYEGLDAKSGGASAARGGGAVEMTQTGATAMV